MNHELKCWDIYFQEIWNGNKPFEFRKNDRGFKVGDTLTLKEIDYVTNQLKNRIILATITYVLSGELWDGLDDDYCVLGLRIDDKNE